MSSVLIITGGGAPKDISAIHLNTYSLIIASDSGIDFAVKHKIDVDIWVGDFDSTNVAPTKVGEIIQKDHEVKVESDTELALIVAGERGMKTYTLVGGGGYRMDHLLQTYALFFRYGVPEAWHTEYESLYSIAQKGIFTPAINQTVSILPALLSGKSVVTAKNLVWPLVEYQLSFNQISLSNRTTAEPLEVWVDGDPIFLCFPVADTES